MTKGMPITPMQLMNLQPGPELDEAVNEELGHFVITKVADWSSDPVAGLKLMDLIEEHVNSVGIVRMGPDCPNIISQMAAIGHEGEATHVYTGSWMESICKAFILYQYGHTGDHFHPKFEEKMRNAPKKVLQ
jgi:hypothetical protein